MHGCDKIKNPCEEATGCPIHLSTECVIYNMNSSDASKLSCINVQNGVTLQDILEKMDAAICSMSPINILSYNIPCLTNSYIVTDFKEYIEAMDSFICDTNFKIASNFTNLSASINNTNVLLNTIYYPHIIDCGSIGLLPSDSIITVLQKYSNAICNILNTCCTDTSPSIVATNSENIAFLTSGVKNHNITAGVIISNVSGNNLKSLPDGLYCSCCPQQNYTQVLNYNPASNSIELSKGGNEIFLPDAVNQTLSIDCFTKVLEISDGNSVDLSCIAGTPFVETVIVANDSPTVDFTTAGISGHIITADVNIPNLISTNPLNKVTLDSGKLFANFVNDKVKVAAVDPLEGYLEDKITGKNNSLITTTVITNGVSYKSEVESTLNTAALLTAITNDPALLSAFCAMVKNCLCYRFRITNIGMNTELYSYTDCSGVVLTDIPLSAGATVDMCGKEANTSSTDISIQNLGTC